MYWILLESNINFLENLPLNCFVDNAYIKISTYLSIRNDQTNQSQKHKNYDHCRICFL